MSDRTIHKTPSLRLGIPGFVYADLFSPHGLCRLHNHWLSRLAQSDPALKTRYDRYRQGESLSELAQSTLLIDLAGTVSQVIEELFPDIADARRAQQHKTQHDLLLFRFKEEVVKRRASKRVVPPEQTEAAIAAAKSSQVTSISRICSVVMRDSESRSAATSSTSRISRISRMSL